MQQAMWPLKFWTLWSTATDTCSVDVYKRQELEHFTLGGLRKAVFDGDVKTGSVMAGQVAGMLHEIKPLHQIFEELQAGCEKRLAELEK